MDIVDIIYKYSKKEGLYIDRGEFVFQLQSHPNYPNLVAVIDTLNFFDIPSGAFSIEPEEYYLLPSNFITFLNLHDKTEPYLIEKIEQDYFYNVGKRKNKIIETEFSNKTNGIFLFIENEEKSKSPKSSKNIKFLPLILLVCLLVYQIFLKSTNFTNTIFLLFSTIGLSLSIVALKDTFGINGSFLNNLCNANSGADCTTVINSKKWKIFEHVNFSDLSLLFFSTQFFLQILSILIGNEFQFFLIQKPLLYSALPFILLSVYYQKFVEKSGVLFVYR